MLLPLTKIFYIVYKCFLLYQPTMIISSQLIYLMSLKKSLHEQSCLGWEQFR